MFYTHNDLLRFGAMLDRLDIRANRAHNPAERADAQAAAALIESTVHFTCGDYLNMARDIDYGLHPQEAINHHLDGYRQRRLQLQDTYRRIADQRNELLQEQDRPAFIKAHVNDLDVGLAMIASETGPVECAHLPEHTPATANGSQAGTARPRGTATASAAELSRISDRFRNLAATAANREFQDFLQAQSLDITIKNGFKGPNKYSAKIDGSVHVKDYPQSPVLRHAWANAPTPEDAVTALALWVSGKIIVLNPSRANRRDIPVPVFHSKS